MAQNPGSRGGIKALFAGIIDGIIVIVSYIVLFIVNILMKFVELLLSIMFNINSRFVKFSKGLQARSGASFSKQRKNQVGMMVVHAGLSRNPEEILGVVLIYSIMLSAFVTFMVTLSGVLAGTFTLPLIIMISFFAPFIAVWVVFYLVFIVLIERRTNMVEKVLPDVLTIMSQNMLAGMTVYNSLWTAARPEFGPLATELQTVARETLGGEAFENSLMTMASRIRSYKLTRSIKLMIEGMKSGGELPAVLQDIATDIRTEQALYKRMSSQTTSQAIFILFAIIFGAPLLFAASLQFIDIFNSIYENVGMDEMEMTQGGMISLSKLPVTADFFWMYTIITLAVLGICGALLIGVIKSGKISSGVPLVPILPTAAILIYLGLLAVIGTFFSGMMNI